MSVVAIDDGFDFHVVVLDDTRVVRVPRRPACAEALAIEAVLLPALAPALPVQVPQFEVAHPEHLLCRDGRLVGVIGWGDTRTGDPALDYSWLLSIPFAHWAVDDELRRRARVYHRLAPWFGAHFEVFHGRAPTLDAVRAPL